MAKERLDILLVERGLAGSRERAKRMIMAGEVLVDGQKIDKAGTTVKAEAEIRLLGHDIPYVSRGGLKLEKAMKEFGATARRQRRGGRTCHDARALRGARCARPWVHRALALRGPHRDPAGRRGRALDKACGAV